MADDAGIDCFPTFMLLVKLCIYKCFMYVHDNMIAILRFVYEWMFVT